VLLLLHRFAPVTRRVLEYAYSLQHPGEQAVVRLRDELAYLRGKGLIGRFQTADAPKGVIDVVYTLTPVGRRDFVKSKQHREERSRWGGVERVRPGLGSVLDRLELILSPKTDLFRLIEFDFLAGRGRRIPNESSPDLQVVVEHRETDKNPWARRRVYYLFEFESPDSSAKDKNFYTRAAEGTPV
jgi:hypothetical protein